MIFEFDVCLADISVGFFADDCWEKAETVPFAFEAIERFDLF